ncbi:hypothetical protein ACS04_17755 [Streptomyces roseus]|uniref:Uncharacterized protein n=1 Tax=Streptomyces roseus TaxID=66430 RepID=A0A0J6XK51_9ACTN|nr:hypothetical protein ACS04_17755 [Streptomyces roseus]
MLCGEALEIFQFRLFHFHEEVVARCACLVEVRLRGPDALQETRAECVHGGFAPSSWVGGGTWQSAVREWLGCGDVLPGTLGPETSGGEGILTSGPRGPRRGALQPVYG